MGTLAEVFSFNQLRNHYSLKRSGVSYTFSGEGPGSLLNFEKYWHFGELWNISHILNEEQNCLFVFLYILYFNNWCSSLRLFFKIALENWLLDQNLNAIGNF